VGATCQNLLSTCGNLHYQSRGSHARLLGASIIDVTDTLQVTEATMAGAAAIFEEIRTLQSILHPFSA
jgi:hypothetical protein